MAAPARKDYAAIAAARIHRPGETTRPPRILVYGRNKKGKTRFCASAPNVLILDPEDGTTEERAYNPAVWPIDKWDDINEALLFLRSGKHEFEWVAVDGITRIHNMAIRWVMRQAEERALDSQPVQIGKQHYGRANEMMKGMLHSFHGLRKLGVVLTAQEKMVEVAELDDMEDDDRTTPPNYMFVPDVSPGTRSSLNAIVDLTGRIYVVRGEFTKKVRGADGKRTVVEYTRQRRLLIGPEDMYETGYRSEHVLPDFIEEPTINRVVRAMKEGVVK